MEIIGFMLLGLLLVFFWGIVQYGFQAAILSLISSIPLGILSAIFVVNINCSADDLACFAGGIFLIPVTIIVIYVVMLLLSPRLVKGIAGFIISAPIGLFIVWVITTNYIPEIDFSPLTTVITIIIGGLIGSYMGMASEPSTFKLKKNDEKSKR